MSSPQTLLESKIQIPQLPPQIIPRARLYDSLDAALQPFMRLTLLSAPTGYGKTSLVSAWVKDRKLPTAWLSLEDQDNDPSRFTSYLLAAFEKGDPTFKAFEIPAIPPASAELENSVLIPMLNQIGRSGQMTLLVLDDYHCIENSNVHHLIGYLLDNLPTQVHLVILTRADPPLSIARLRGRGQLNELRMEDLRFEPDETQSFLHWFEDIRLSPDDVQTLTQRTEGWIAGLQMAAVSLRGHTDQRAIVQGFSGDHQYIMDFLLDEVLRRQPPHIQSFLLHTSILPRLCGSLCDTIMAGTNGDLPPGQEVLHQLEQANLFIISLDEKREWYRYHRLFADLLQARLQGKGLEHIQSLHRRASQWFEAHRLIEEAIHHALLSGDTNLAANLVERTSQELLMRSETTTFLRLLQRLPREEVTRRPRLGAYQAWALLFQGAPLSVVEAQLPDRAKESDPPGAAALLNAFVLLSQGKVPEGLALAEHAYEVLPEDEIYLRDFAAFCVAASRIAAGDVAHGMHLLEETTQAVVRAGTPSSAVIFLTELAEMRMKELAFDEAKELYQRALSTATDRDGHRYPIAGRALIGLGNLALERYDLKEAESLLNEGIQLIENWSLISTLEARLFLATVHFARDEAAQMAESFILLHELAHRFDASEIDDRVVEMVEADFKGRQGDLDAVRAWVIQRGLGEAPNELPRSYQEDHITPRLYKYELPILIRLFTAEARYDDAQEGIDQLIARSEQANRPLLILEAEILQALLYHAQGQPEASSISLTRALERACTVRVMRPFLTQGETLIQLLKECRKTLSSPELRNFVEQLMRKVDPTSAKTTSSAELLSLREREVLQLLPSDMTVEALADELYITVNTVRSHIKNIYAKLDVHSRHQAVDRARSLNLITPPPPPQ
jgi:LuxR family maltose regulon positive regulatory protein